MDLPKLGGAVAAIGATLVALPLGFFAIPVAMAAAFGVKGILEGVERGKSRGESTEDDDIDKSYGGLSADEILKLVNTNHTPIRPYRANFQNNRRIENDDTDLGIFSPNYLEQIRAQYNNPVLNRFPTEYFVQNQPRPRQRVRIVRIPTERRTMPRRNIRTFQRPGLRIDEYGQIFEG